MEENIKEVKIGQFKTEKKFLSFVTVVKNTNVRLIGEKAILEGWRISDYYKGFKFEIEICDEGVNIEVIETPSDSTEITNKNLEDILEDICYNKVTTYAKKYVLNGISFISNVGEKCFLEVDQEKPINKLRNIIKNNSDKKELNVEVNDKAKSMLSKFLKNRKDVDTQEEVKVEVIETPDSKSNFQQTMEESFKKMSEDKIQEIRDRIEAKNNEIYKLNSEKNKFESKLAKSEDELRVLNSRLESTLPNEEPCGIVFRVSEIIRPIDTDLSERDIEIANKILDVLNVKSKQQILEKLTGGHFEIKFANKEDFEKCENLNIEKIRLDPSDTIKFISSDTITYSGDKNWHEITEMMIKSGFEVSAEFEKIVSDKEEEIRKELESYSDDSEIDEYVDGLEEDIKTENDIK